MKMNTNQNQKMDTELPYHENPKEAPNPSPNINNKNGEDNTRETPRTKKVDFIPASKVDKTEKKKDRDLLFSNKV